MKIGFIGGSGHHYLRGALAQRGDHDIAVGGDGHDDAASERFATALKAKWFADGRQLLDTFKPDVLSIGAVYAFNGDWAAEALARDIPTVTDKPIAVTWAQLDRLRELARQHPNRILLTEFDFRARPEFRAARQIVRAGRIGTPILITAQKSYRFGTRPAWYSDRDSYGGTFLWIASHAVDVIPFITGQSLVRGIGQGGNLSQPTYGSMEDHVAGLFELSGGGTALIHADFLRPAAAATHGDDRLRIAGSAGLLEISGGRCRVTTPEQGETDVTDEVSARPMHAELIDALLGNPSELFSTTQSLESAAILLRAREAVDRGHWVKLTE
jgi:predicted dehydrogenase